ncbi:hypothetical protein, partial [Burkholderia stagnalis]|uniref:hypothetical protein n=1 Tax=Burkholderia stagnalis TaxID=1503054 RepID=UPI001C89DA49
MEAEDLQFGAIGPSMQLVAQFELVLGHAFRIAFCYGNARDLRRNFVASQAVSLASILSESSQAR